MAGTATYWLLSLNTSRQAVPAHAQVSGLESALRGDITRLFGDPAVPTARAVPVVAEASRFKVLGVVAAVAGGKGVALLSIDGRAARAYSVGSLIEGDWVLQSVTQKAVAVGPRSGGAAFTLELQALPPAATGQLSAGGSGDEATAPAAVRVGGGFPGALPNVRGAMPTPTPSLAPRGFAPAPQIQAEPIAMPSVQTSQGSPPPIVRPDGTVVPQEPTGTPPPN